MRVLEYKTAFQIEKNYQKLNETLAHWPEDNYHQREASVLKKVAIFISGYFSGGHFSGGFYGLWKLNSNIHVSYIRVT